MDRVSQGMWEHQDTPLISVCVSEGMFAAGMLPQCVHSHVLSLQSLQPVLELLNYSVMASTVSLAPSRRTPVGHATRDLSQPAVKERTPSATNPALVSTRWGTHPHPYVAMCFIHVRTYKYGALGVMFCCLADPCLDNVMNCYETVMDCGGPLCFGLSFIIIVCSYHTRYKQLRRAGEVMTAGEKKVYKNKYIGS